MYSDAAWGFNTLQSMVNGGKFNFESTVDPSNLANNITSFNNTFTPGQYLFSFFLVKYLHLDIGESLIIIVPVFNLVGLLGFYHLFLNLTFSKRTTLFCILIIVLQRYFSLPFSIYNGGETLIFGLLPWCILFVEKLKLRTLLGFLIIIFIGLVGFFIKASFLITLVSLCFYLFLRCIDFPNIKLKNIFIDGLIITLALTLTFAVCYFTFLNTGLYSKQKFDPEFNLNTTLYIFSAIVNSAFSLDDIFNKIFLFPGNTFGDTAISIYTMVWNFCLAVLSIFIIKEIYNLKGFYNLRLLTLSFLFVYVIAFLILWNKKEITSSLEMRHLRPLGLIFIPAIVLLIKQNKNKVLVFSTGLIVLVSIIYGLISFLQRELNIYNTNAFGNHGFRHGIIDQETIDYLHQIDKVSDRNTIIFVPSPEIALEISNARKIISQVDFTSVDNLKNTVYEGKVKKLYLCLQRKFEHDGKQEAIISSFKGYHHFKIIFSNQKFNLIELID